MPARGRVLRVDPGPDGSFAFPGLPEGTWKVSAWAGSGKLPYSGEATANAGDSGVEIRVEPRGR